MTSTVYESSESVGVAQVFRRSVGSIRVRLTYTDPVKNWFRMITLALIAFVGLVVSPAYMSAGRQDSTAKQTNTGKNASKTSPGPTAQEIADAKAKGLVWVNTSTRVYHKSSSGLYGTTKHGKFMTEEDAKKAGYRPAKGSEPAKKS